MYNPQKKTATQLPVANSCPDLCQGRLRDAGFGMENTAFRAAKSHPMSRNAAPAHEKWPSNITATSPNIAPARKSKTPKSTPNSPILRCHEKWHCKTKPKKCHCNITSFKYDLFTRKPTIEKIDVCTSTTPQETCTTKPHFEDHPNN